MIADHPCTPPRRQRLAGRLAAGALALALLASPLTGAPARPTPAELTEQLRSALPSGWTLTPSATPGVPGWQSVDTASANLQIGDGTRAFTVSVVPLDWIGVQAKGGAGTIVRQGPKAKVVLAADAGDRLAWLDTFAPDLASLSSAAGSTSPYAGQYIRVESELRTLLRRSGVTRDQAAASCIALGVPAEDLIRTVALDTRSPVRLAAVHSLRHFPGKSTRESLLKIIADRSRDASADKCRIAALQTCAALMIDSHGPAVVSALQAEKDEAMVVPLAAEVNRLRYAPAAAELRRWLKSAQSLETKVAAARALATLRDPAAGAEIRAALQAPGPKRAAVAPSALAAVRHQLAQELHRLTGEWGTEARGVRLSVVFDSPDRVVVHVENMGESPLHFIPFSADGRQPWPVGLEVTLDGSPISPPGPRDADLGRTTDSLAHGIAPGTSSTFELQLAIPLSPRSEHVLTATWFGLVANEVSLRAGSASQAAEPAS